MFGNINSKINIAIRAIVIMRRVVTLSVTLNNEILSNRFFTIAIPNPIATITSTCAWSRLLKMLHTLNT